MRTERGKKRERRRDLTSIGSGEKGGGVADRGCPREEEQGGGAVGVGEKEGL